MWTPRDFSYRKLTRKCRQDGPKEAIRSSTEFATRKLLAPPILHGLIDLDFIQTIDRSELFSVSDCLYVSQKNSNVGTSTELNSSEFVVGIKNGYVLPNTGLGLDSSGRPIQETVEPPKKQNNYVIETLVWHAFHDPPKLSSALLRGNTSPLESYVTERDVICPLCPRFTNYYHWLIETVPKLRYAREYETKFDVDVTYLVPSDAPSWLDQTLELLGVADSDIEHAIAPVYRAKHLLVPSFPDLKPRNYHWIRESVLANVSPDKEDLGVGNNVYISRANAIERRVVNETELVKVLSEYGFESYQLEEHTVKENATLFSEAKIIVSPHGAGLTDIVFSEESSVIELFGSKIKNPYEKLAKMINLDYYKVVCKPRSTDIEANISQLEDLLSQM